MERLTPKQRQAIIERDNHTSQMRHYSEEKGWHTECPNNCPVEKIKRKLNVHHVNPNGNGGSNDATNLLTIYECEHTGKKCNGELVDPEEKFVVHPDMIEGFKNYRKGNKNAIAEVMQKRKPLKERGEIYWNTDHDAEMQQTAIERTLNALNLGWIYINKHKKTK